MPVLSQLFSAENLLHTSGGTIVIIFMLVAFARGIARQLMGMVNLALGFGVGYFVFKTSPSYLQQWFNPVPTNAPIICSVLAGLGVQMLTRKLLYGLIQPGTGVPDSGGMRVRSAGLSLIPAAFLLWVLGMGVRWTGALSQMEFIDEGIRAEKQSLGEAYPLFARLQQTLATGWAGNILNRTDPISSTEAGALCSLLLIQRDPESWQRLHRDPEALVILKHPAVGRLLKDRDWNKPASFKNYAELITLPELAVALKDPELVARLQKLNVEVTARHAIGATPAIE